MKHLRLVTSLLLVMVLVSATGFAGKKAAIGEDRVLTRSSHMKTVQGDAPLSMPKYAVSPDATPLSGTYRIGVGKNFTTMSAALISLAVNGVNGPVTFLLTDASYTETGLLMGAPAGVSAVNTITFQPDSATAGVTITLTNDATNGGGWVLTGSQYTTINGTKKNGIAGNQDLTIQFDPAQAFPASGVAAPLRIRDGASHVTVENCKIFSMYNGAVTAARPALSVTAAGATPNTYITIDNNLITRASLGIAVVGGVNFEDHFTISNNKVGNQFGTTFGGQLDYVLITGIYTEWSDHITISGNQVKGVVETQPVATQGGTSDAARTCGIYELWAHNTVVSKNIVDSVVATVAGAAGTTRRNYGIRMQGLTQNGGSPYATTNAHLINNSITRVFGVGTTSGGDVGIEIFPGHGDTLYHNSISLTGPGVAGRGAVGMQLTGDQGASSTLPIPLGWFDIENNAVAVTRTGVSAGTAGPYRLFSTRGPDISTADGNVYYSTTGFIDIISGAGDILQWQAVTGQDVHSSTNDPLFTSASDLHLTGGLSSALDLGRPLASVTDDIDGQARDPLTPDAGFDENGTAASLTDVGPIKLMSPSATGFPQGVPVTAATARYYNYHNTTVSYTAQLVVKDPFGATLGTFTSPVTAHAPFSSVDVPFVISFTPDSLGAYPFEMTSLLGGDGNTSNDGPLVAAVSAVPLVNGVAYSSGFETPTDNFGWQGDDQWVNGDPGPSIKFYVVDQSLLNAGGAAYADVKVGGHINGPHSGSKSWFVQSTEWGGLGYDDATVSTLYTPFFNFTGYGSQPFLSFYLSMATEPAYDIMEFEYSLDSGKTWHPLGAVNDPNGINWYSTTTYANADNHTGSYDHAGAEAHGMVTGVTAFWTSNGDPSGSRLNGFDYATGPFGYVYNELKLPVGFVGKNYVRFRAQIWGDGNSYDDGWSIDDFSIATTGAASTASIAGNVFNDGNGDGVKNGSDANISGAVIKLSGSKNDSTTTDVNGNYSFSSLKPGIYNIVQKTPPANSSTSVPANLTGVQSYSVAPAQVITGANFGNFVSNISGMKFEDKNDNATNDDTAPLSGWTIELRKASDSSLVTSAVTNALGNYAFHPLPGTYIVDEVLQGGWRQNVPASKYYLALFVDTVSGSANITGKDFGNWKKASIITFVTTDQNGNGVYDGLGDNFPLPAATTERFEFLKNGVHVSFDTVGNAIDSKSHTLLDTGSYKIKLLSSPPAGWVGTLRPDSVTITIGGTNSSSQIISERWLDFKRYNISGKVYEDHNGNGAVDGGDQGVAGRTINLTGTGGGSTVTDTGGNYSYSNLGPGARVITQVIGGGEINISPVAHQYSFTGGSQNLSGDLTGQDFGNFKTITISGVKYRDRNGNGTQDAGDNGLSGWTINGDNGAGVSVTNGAGAWSFGPLGPGTYHITETAQLGWTKTEPVGPNYTVVASSGVDVAGLKFGNKSDGDTSLYRTWTYAELSAASEAKPVKRPKVGKPYVKPNSANMLSDLLLPPKSAILQVGLSGQLIGGKEKGWILIAKQGDMFKTFNDKGVVHVGTPKALSFDNTGLKRILKKQKTFSAKKFNNILAADLLVLKINLAASALGQTSAGLGNVVYCEPTNPLGAARMTLADIAAAADTFMTNWDILGLPGFTAPYYTMYDSVIAKINAAFSTGSTTDISTDSATWHSTAVVKLQWKLKGTAQSVAYMCAPGPGVAPSSVPVRTDGQQIAIPKTFGMYQNYPNPFNPTTTISFDLPQSAIVTLKVYNILGQEVATLLNHESFDAGNWEQDFDASMLTSGVYFYRVTAEGVNDDGLNTGNNFTQVKKMLLVK